MIKHRNPYSWPPHVTRSTRNKEQARRWATKAGRKVLWKDDRGFWHAATDRRNTPYYATETEEIK